MKHEIDLSHDYQTTIYDVARRLLAAGADPDDTVETRRGGVLSMTGLIGHLAKWRVVFRGSGPCLMPYRDRTPACVAPEKSIAATIHPDLHERAP